MDGGVLGYPTVAGSSGGRKRKRETPTGGGWYRFYGKLSVNHKVLQAGQAVLQLHPALDLFHRRPVRTSV